MPPFMATTWMAPSLPPSPKCSRSSTTRPDGETREVLTRQSLPHLQLDFLMSMTIATPLADVHKPRRRARKNRQWQGLLYIAPAILLVTIFFVIPVLFTVWMSFH